MTIKVVGTWEFGWSTPIMEYDLWEFTLRSFGVELIDGYYMTPVSGIDKAMVERVDIPTVISENTSHTPVYLEENGTIDLADFVHPENALYITGKAGYSPWVAAGSSGISVKIETLIPGGMLWPHQCIGIVLYDRYKKSWQSP